MVKYISLENNIFSYSIHEIVYSKRLDELPSFINLLGEGVKSFETHYLNEDNSTFQRYTFYILPHGKIFYSLNNGNKFILLEKYKNKTIKRNLPSWW